MSTVKELATSDWTMSNASEPKRQSTIVHTIQCGASPTVHIVKTYPLPAGTTVSRPDRWSVCAAVNILAEQCRPIDLQKIQRNCRQLLSCAIRALILEDG